MVEHKNLHLPDSADENSEGSPISGMERTAFALKDSPPGDFNGSDAKRQSRSRSSRTRIVRLLGILSVALLGALFIYFSRIQTYEIARQVWPDGTGDAILMGFSADTGEYRRYEVCMQRPIGSKVVRCQEVAYLGGVPTETAVPPITLVWITPSQLEIRYVSASSVHVYQPMFVWSSARYASRGRSFRPLQIKAVKAGDADGTRPVQPR
jgi:hypothetical protein